MISFFGSLFILIAGYFLYGKFVESIIKPTDEVTPAIAHADGVDYVPLSTARSFLIQLLNIAGLGPIFGAIGELYGDLAFIYGSYSAQYLLVQSMIIYQECCHCAIMVPVSPK